MTEIPTDNGTSRVHRCAARLQRWLLAQQIVVAAFDLLETLPDRVPRRAARENVHRLLVQYSDTYGSPQTLPSIALNMLGRARLLLGDHKLFDTLWASAESSRASLAGSTVLAHVILNGTGDGPRMARLGRWLLGNKWKSLMENDEALVALSGALDRVRARHGTSLDRLEAVTELSALVAHMPHYEHVENVLLHHCFAWPLLVGDRSATAVALPVLVDARVPAMEEKPPRIEVQGQQAFALARSFYLSLVTASDAAWLLWRRQHGGAGSYRTCVQNYTARFDFSFAGNVVLGAWPRMNDQGALQLVGWSASAYFAQVLLGKLLGRRSTFGDAVTGAIGEQVRDLATDDLLMDHYVDRIEHVSPKLRYVFDAECADVVVVPKPNEHEAAALLAQAGCRDLACGDGTADLQRQSSQVFAVETLSTVADIVQHEGWRRAHYVRCPEVGWATVGLATEIRRNPEFRPRDGIRAVLNLLGNAKQAVLDVASFGPETVGQSLAYVDSFLREHEVGTAGDFIRADVVAPSLSWAFVRLPDEGEEDAELWHVVWRVIGAPMEDFYRFCLSPTANAAATQVIDALNRFVPNADHPSHRAPDILVLLGVTRARESFAAWTGKANRPLAPAAVIAEIQRRHQELLLSPSRHSCQRLQQALGHARVLLVGTDDHGASNADTRAPNLDDLTEVTVDRLRAVAVFRWGFTHHSAGAVLAGLGVQNVEVKDVLSDLVAQGVLRWFGGQYFVPKGLHQQLLEEVSRDRASVCAKRHLAAAWALAPYAEGGTSAGLPLERALLPANIVEARWHFTQAGEAIARASVDTYKLFESLGAERTTGELDGWRDLGRDVSNARQSLERASLWPGPGLIHELLRRGTHDANEAAYHTVMQHMDGVMKHPLNDGVVPPHPILLLSAARAAAGRCDLWNTAVDKQRRQEHMLYAAQAFERSLAGCQEYPSTLMTKAEQVWTRLHVLCHYAEFLHDQEANPIRRVLGDRSTSVIDMQVWNAKAAWANESGRPAITPQWLERQADEQEAAAHAAELYMLGHRLYPKWHQFGFKGLGALSVDGGRRGDIGNWLESTPDRIAACAQLALRCAGERRRTEKWENDPWERVRGYWKAAVREVQAAWCDDPTVRAALWGAFVHQHVDLQAWGIAAPRPVLSNVARV